MDEMKAMSAWDLSALIEKSLPEDAEEARNALAVLREKVMVYQDWRRKVRRKEGRERAVAGAR